MLLVSFGNVIDAACNARVMALAARIKADPFPGFVECVPAYASLAVVFDIRLVADRHPERAPMDTVHAWVSSLAERPMHEQASQNPIKRIPVCYDGPDLGSLAAFHRLDPDEVVHIHSSTTYRVFMMGFIPGFAYMGSVDERIATPRLSSPRKAVPAGSVGIAGMQTGIYPLTSPGGWQLIGRTPLRLFRTDGDPSFYLQPGDAVEFFSISESEFANWHVG